MSKHGIFNKKPLRIYLKTQGNDYTNPSTITSGYSSFRQHEFWCQHSSKTPLGHCLKPNASLNFCEILKKNKKWLRQCSVYILSDMQSEQQYGVNVTHEWRICKSAATLIVFVTMCFCKFGSTKSVFPRGIRG